MGSRIVEPGKSSIQRVEDQLPALPKAESYRVRSAARSFYDVLLPTAMRRIAEALECEDPKVYMWAVDKVVKATLLDLPNEKMDPDMVVVDAKAEDVADLEKETENGTGLPDDDK